MGIEIPYSEDEINKASNKIISTEKVENGYVRPVVWRGSEMMAISAQQTKIHVAIATWEWGSYFDPKLKVEGIKLNISNWRRPAPNTIPWDTKASGLYMICTLSKHEAEQQGYSESLMLDFEGYVAEATGANIFFVKNDEIHTPIADCFLDGITRQTVIEIAKKENSVIFLEENYEQRYDGFDPNNPESVISLVLMQEEYLDQSILAANQIQKSFVNNLKRKNRTVKQAGFIVLKYTYMPSVLIETGFLTNKTEGQYLNSKKGQSEMAQAISDAINKYFLNLNGNVSDITLELSNSTTKDVFEFKVRIASGSKMIPLKSYNFKGLKSLSLRKNSKLYKYYFGSSSNIEDARKNLIKAKSAGFKDAFIELFKNNKLYSIDKYLNELEN